jgi:hypothetical protein
MIEVFIFSLIAGYLSFIWMLYPICWGVSDGGNVISPLKEMIFYGSKLSQGSLPSTPSLLTYITSPRYSCQARLLLLSPLESANCALRAIHAPVR